MEYLNTLAEVIHNTSVEKGWWENPNRLEKLLMIHSEVSEVVEDYRNHKGWNETYYEGDKPCGIPIEIADIIIRCLDLCGACDINIGQAISEKIAFNATRPHKHGDKRC